MQKSAGPTPALWKRYLYPFESAPTLRICLILVKFAKTSAIKIRRMRSRLVSAKAWGQEGGIRLANQQKLEIEILAQFQEISIPHLKL